MARVQSTRSLIMDNVKNWRFEIVKVKDLGNGKSEVTMDLSNEFVSWFKEDQGLKRWSAKRFNEWFLDVLVEEATK